MEQDRGGSISEGYRGRNCGNEIRERRFGELRENARGENGRRTKLEIRKLARRGTIGSSSLVVT